MSENLIESVEPVLAPPVTRHPTGVTDGDDAAVEVAALFACCCYADDGDDD